MHIVNIIPTYNEKENILFINLVVDDNSPDGTGNLVKQISQNDKSVVLLSGPKQGLGSAMIRGIKYAIGKLHTDVITTSESKISFNPKYFNIYLHDVVEYIILSFKIRLERHNIKI